MSPALLGFVRALGVALVMALLTFIGDASHLTGILNPVTAAIVAGAALALEHRLAEGSGTALFGAVRTKKGR